MGLKECEFVGVDYKEIQRLVRMLDKAGKLADKLGVHMFGSGSGSLQIRKFDGMSDGALVLEEVTYGEWTGGDGGAYDRGDGFIRGE